MISLILISICSIFNSAMADTTHYQLVIGSYTSRGNPGIEVYDFNSITAKTSALYKLKNANASYQTFSADDAYMFSVAEEGKGKASISAYHLNNVGQYELTNTTPNVGEGPCFVLYREASQTVYSANYGGGSLSVFKTYNGSLLPIAQHIKYTGSSIDKNRQTSSHAHNVVLSPDQNYLYVTDLGSDKIYQHKIYADGTIDEFYKSINIDAGNGPRHMVFNKNGSYAYLISEMKGVVDVFRVTDNQFEKVQTIVADTTSSLSSRGSADIHISPNAKWLVTSNRITSNELTIFTILSNGLLEKVGHQVVAKKPRNFSFDPTGKFVFVASQDDHKVQVFSFDDRTGKLIDTKQDILVDNPVCLNFLKMEVEVDPEAQIKMHNIKLIPPTQPIANYVKYVQVGNLVFLSGHGPEKPEGGQVQGKLGKDLTLEEGQAAARLTGISLLSTLKGYLGDLNKVKRIVKVLGLVNSTAEFTQQPLVMNGFSNLMVEVFGNRGKHARSAVGTNTLPNNFAVEIEMIVELK